MISIGRVALHGARRFSFGGEMNQITIPLAVGVLAKAEAQSELSPKKQATENWQDAIEILSQKGTSPMSVKKSEVNTLSVGSREHLWHDATRVRQP
jgi:hypothetical protein